MAVRNGFAAKDDGRDELAQLLQESRQSSRRDIWLWLYLNHYEEAELDPATCNGLTMRSVIAHCLKRKNDVRRRLSQEKDRFMVPDDQLKWIDGGERQHQWLLSRVETLTAPGPLRGLPRGLVHLIGRNRLIAMLDLWNVDIADKAEEIERLRQKWLRHKAGDSAFVWFEDKKAGARRCECAWEWLTRNHQAISRRQLPISNYQELLIYFDRAKLERNELKAIIQRIKQRWSRQQFDERTADKKQVNVMLSTNVITLLDELAKKHDLKRAQMIELLITMETDRA
ncbi:hypothetical protein [Pseudomonas zeae]|uniref:hypothetical protein n=1 Tax=Pseudomonas zeae TaxID=2745510 RepID=UPI0039E00DE4